MSNYKSRTLVGSSGKREQTIRVKPRKKQAKTTVGITISPTLLAEARKKFEHKQNNRTSIKLNPRISTLRKSNRKL